METNSNGGATLEKLLAEREERIRALEQAAAEQAQTYGRQAEKFEETLAVFQARVKALEDDTHQWQHDYERLRVQKGGFGFKALMLSGFAGFMFGALVCYAFFRPRDHDAAAFTAFREANQFQYELALSKGRFDDVEEALRVEAALPENAAIEPELEFARKLVLAASRGAEGK
jgi:hypothetical protein